MFDHYVSFGVNCEAAFQFRRILGRDSASFFSWNVTSLDVLVRILENRFEGVFEPQNIKKHGWGLATDAGYGYQFHSPFSHDEPREDPDFDEKLAKHREKAAHLIEKFFRNAQSDERTAYFYKTTKESPRADSVKVRDILLDIHGKENFTLVVVQEKDKKEEPWGERALANVYVNRFAPWSDASDGHVTSWDKIFRQLPHKDPMRFAGY